jgi:hypothetical protein
MKRPWLYTRRGLLAYFFVPRLARRWHQENLAWFDAQAIIDAAERIALAEAIRVIREEELS